MSSCSPRFLCLEARRSFECRRQVGHPPQSGDEHVLLADRFVKFPESWSRDGRFILYFGPGPASLPNARPPNTIWVLPLFAGSGKSRRPVAATHVGAATGRNSSIWRGTRSWRRP